MNHLHFISNPTKIPSPPESQMEKAHETALTQMRRSVQKLGSSAENYGDPSLTRFLLARSMDSGKAAKMFVQWLKWRAAFVPSRFIADSEVPDELAARKIFLQGLSRDGYSVMVVKACRHFPSKDQFQFKKFVVHLLDKVIASAIRGREVGDEKLVAILDLQQLTYKNVDAHGLIKGFQFLQAYYPERLAKCYLLNMPRFLVNVWKMVSRLLDKETLEKIVMVSNEDEKRDFIRVIGEEVLPEEYGGRATLVALQDVLLTPSDEDTPK